MFGRGSNRVQPAGQDASETLEDGDLGRSDDNSEDRIPEFEEDRMAGCRAMGAASPRHEGGRQEVCLADIGKISGGANLPQTPVTQEVGGIKVSDTDHGNIWTPNTGGGRGVTLTSVTRQSSYPVRNSTCQSNSSTSPSRNKVQPEIRIHGASLLHAHDGRQEENLDASRTVKMHKGRIWGGKRSNYKPIGNTQVVIQKVFRNALKPGKMPRKDPGDQFGGGSNLRIAEMPSEIKESLVLPNECFGEAG
ncbi:hypothetical protein B0H16DRAFT_1474616 [Mycena metata]|uniref:Uncharacterized protein n=1 Tax=Mycena metata TaxID=1033252 RepID=A0AAD7MJU0_9AGAR|nr:hypothetical protein B0H16DRAFT_1474616 [Mycena metata]